MIKRIFDIVFSLTGILILSPFLLLFSILVAVNSGFPVLYIQKRVGKNSSDFSLLKFRTMQADSDKKGLITVGSRDPRVTGIGYFLRKYKIDELPQLFNVLAGDMSLVGPRPEVRKYVELYNTEQQKVLSVKPGITDYASIEYSNENEMLLRSEKPEELYIQDVMPAKLKLNLKYIQEQSLLTDIKIILKTIGKLIS
jgi:lipopolysaccharide/colanic/teichoic acid biosynthesis glycosyltransferase